MWDLTERVAVRADREAKVATIPAVLIIAGMTDEHGQSKLKRHQKSGCARAFPLE
jgi:hypothetical protein